MQTPSKTHQKTLKNVQRHINSVIHIQYIINYHFGDTKIITEITTEITEITSEITEITEITSKVISVGDFGDFGG